MPAKSKKALKKPENRSKWHFHKNEEGKVRVLYSSSDRTVLALDGSDPGFVSSMKPNETKQKLKIKYSSNKILLLSLQFLTPKDEINRKLFTAINDMTKFGELVNTLLGIPFAHPDSDQRLNAPPAKRACIDTSTSSSGASTSTNSLLTDSPEEELQSITTEYVTNADDDCIMDAKLEPYAISPCPKQVLVSSLKAPREDYSLRPIDDIFVKSLMREMEENDVSIGVKPLLVVVKGLAKAENFKQDLIDSYELEVIGGNHRREAMQALQRDNPAKYKYTEAVLFTEMPKKEVLELASTHNRMDQVHHNMTNQDMVRLCHKILHSEFAGQKTEEWKEYCKAICKSKESLEFVFLISACESETLTVLEKVFQAYEAFETKGQCASVSQARKLLSGSMQRPDLKASKFKHVRKLTQEELRELYQALVNREISFTEMTQRAVRIKGLRQLRDNFVSMAGCASWDECTERFPDFTSDELLVQFIGSLKKGKDAKKDEVSEKFRAFVERAVHAQASATMETDHSNRFDKNGSWYCGLTSEGPSVSQDLLRGVPFNGADLVLIQQQQGWTKDHLKAAIRQVCGLNTRAKLSRFAIVLRTTTSSELEECTPSGRASKLYVAWSNTEPKVDTALTDGVEILTVLIVGGLNVASVNWLVAEGETVLTKHLIDLFVPSRGTVLQLGNSKVEVASSLNPAIDARVNLLAIYESDKMTQQFISCAALHCSERQTNQQ